MDIKNLNRAAEINTYLPAIDEARKAISGGKASVRIVTQAGKIINLPENLNYNIVHVLNCEYERLREEVKKL